MTKLEQAKEKILDKIIAEEMPETIELLSRAYVNLSAPLVKCECDENGFSKACVSYFDEVMKR